MQNSLNSTINDMEWSAILNKNQEAFFQDKTQNILSFMNSRAKCPSDNNVFNLCLNQSCSANYRLLCLNQVCKCRFDHRLCETCQIACIEDMIAEKKKRISCQKKYMSDFFDKKIMEMLDLKQYFIDQAQKSQESGLSASEIKFMNFISAPKEINIETKTRIPQTSQQMSSKQLVELYRTATKLLQNPQSSFLTKTQQQFENFDEELKCVINSFKNDYQIMAIGQNLKKSSSLQSFYSKKPSFSNKQIPSKPVKNINIDATPTKAKKNDSNAFFKPVDKNQQQSKEKIYTRTTTENSFTSTPRNSSIQKNSSRPSSKDKGFWKF